MQCIKTMNGGYVRTDRIVSIEPVPNRPDQSYVSVAGYFVSDCDGGTSEVRVAISAEKLRELLGWEIAKTEQNDAEKSVYDIAFRDVSNTDYE